MRLARLGLAITSCAAVALLVAASPAHATPIPPGGGGAVAADQPVTVTLTLTGDPAVQSYAAAVADPSRATFGRHLTRQQLRERFGANPAQVNRVTAWATRAGFVVRRLDDTGTRITLSGTAR